LKVDRLTSGPGTTIQFAAVSNKTYTIQYKESVAHGKWAKLVDVPARSSNRVEQIADPFPLTRNRLYRLATPRLPDLLIPGPAILSSPQSIAATAGTARSLMYLRWGPDLLIINGALTAATWPARPPRI